MKIQSFPKAVLGLATAAMMTAGAAFADFPSQPITIVVPWPAGTSPDAAMRLLADMSSDELGQPVVVTNVTGGGGVKGTKSVADATDGHTLINHWVAPQVVGRVVNGDVGFDETSFSAIAGYRFSPFIAMVSAQHPAQNMDEFIAWVKEQDSINVGVCAALSVPRFVIEAWLQEQGVENYNPVPFPGCNVDNNKGVLDGTLDVTVTNLTPLKTFGAAVRPLGIFTEERFPTAPDVPTAAEQGHGLGWGMSARGWAGLSAPASMPEADLAKLRDVFGKHIQSEEFAAKMAETHGVNVAYMAPASFEQLWVDSMTALKPIIEAITANN